MVELQKVAVIIPVYRVEKYLAASIESVLNQSYKNIEIVLINDGSPDGCPAICDDYANKYANIHVIHKKNGGLSSARNAGLDYVCNRADYVMFLDSDDQLQTGSVEQLLNEGIQNDAQVVLSDRYIKVDEDNGNKRLCLHFHSSYYTDSPKEFVLNVIMEAGRAWRATAVLYSLDIIRKFNIRFPQGMISEDIVFNLQIFQRAKRIKISQFPALLNLQRSGSISRSFQKNFHTDMLLIDDTARAFIAQTGELHLNSYADALLTRNTIVYLFSIFSKRNNFLNITEKKQLASSLINNKRISKVLYKKYPMPYFDSKMARVAYCISCYLIRMRMNHLAYKIMQLQ